MDIEKLNARSKKLFWISLIWLIVMNVLIGVIAGFSPREGSSSTLVESSLEIGFWALVVGNFVPYILYYLFVARFFKRYSQIEDAKALKPFIIPLIIIHVIFHFAMGIIIVFEGHGEYSNIYTQDSKRIIGNVEDYEFVLSQYIYIEGVESSLSKNELRPRLVGKPLEGISGYVGRIVYLYSFEETAYSCEDKYKAVCVEVHSETRKPAKAQLLKTDVSKFTEKQAREFLEKLAKNGEKK